MDSYDLEIFKGETFTLSIILKDSNEVPIDLTDYNVSGYLKYKYSDSNKLIDLNIQKVAPYTSGAVSLTLSSTGTEQLPVTLGFYDIEIFHTGLGETLKLLRGKASIFPEATY